MSQVYIGGLHHHISEHDLHDLFAAYGTVKQAKIVRDRDDGNSRGFGFVMLESREDAERAIAALNGKGNGTELFGSSTVVSHAREL